MKYVNIVLICIILASCAEKKLDIENNYILYIKEFGRDPILIDDELYKPPNKNRLVVYPKSEMETKIRPRRYVGNDNKSVELEIKIIYSINDPIIFHRNNIKLSSLDIQIKMNMRAIADDFFYGMPSSRIILGATEFKNELNQELLEFIEKYESPSNSINRKIEGVEISKIEILYNNNTESDNDERTLREKVNESMFDKS